LNGWDRGTGDGIYQIKANESGYIPKLDSRAIGESATILGAGREKKESEIDLSVGIVLEKKVGDKVNTGEVLATVYFNSQERLKKAQEKLLSSFTIGEEKTEKPPLVLATISKEGIKKFI